MQYMILIFGEDGVFERLPDDEQAAHLKKHTDLQHELKDKGQYLDAARLMGPETAVTVSQRGDSVLVTDGPFAETKEQVLGYYLIEADGIEAAIEAARKLPQRIAHMEVRPVMWGSSEAHPRDGGD